MEFTVTLVGRVCVCFVVFTQVPPYVLKYSSDCATSQLCVFVLTSADTNVLTSAQVAPVISI